MQQLSLSCCDGCHRWTANHVLSGPAGDFPQKKRNKKVIHQWKAPTLFFISFFFLSVLGYYHRVVIVIGNCWRRSVPPRTKKEREHYTALSWKCAAFTGPRERRLMKKKIPGAPSQSGGSLQRRTRRCARPAAQSSRDAIASVFFSLIPQKKKNKFGSSLFFSSDLFNRRLGSFFTLSTNLQIQMVLRNVH